VAHLWIHVPLHCLILLLFRKLAQLSVEIHDDKCFIELFSRNFVSRFLLAEALDFLEGASVDTFRQTADALYDHLQFNHGIFTLRTACCVLAEMDSALVRF
jgi:hypothetical protein